MGTKRVNSDLKLRMLQICEALGVSPNKLSEDSGMSREYIRQMKDNISSDLLRYIIRMNKQINLIWLLTGEGNMINEAPSEEMSLLVRMLNEEREKNKILLEKIENLEKDLARFKA